MCAFPATPWERDRSAIKAAGSRSEALDDREAVFLPPKGLRRLFAPFTGHGDGAGDGAGEILPVRQAHPFAQGEANDVFRGAAGIVGSGLHPDGIFRRQAEDTAGVNWL